MLPKPPPRVAMPSEEEMRDIFLQNRGKTVEEAPPVAKGTIQVVAQTGHAGANDGDQGREVIALGELEETIAREQVGVGEQRGGALRR